MDGGGLRISMKPGDLVQVRLPNGWMDHERVDGRKGILLEIRPIEYPTAGHKQHDYIVLVNGKTLTFKKRLLDFL